jgi:DNA excision repair protein ERCC-3
VGAVATPLVVQQDGELILATGATGARGVADTLRRFAVLEKCPGAFHHYRLTRHSLWNAAAAGIDAGRIVAFLERASGAALPETVARRIAATLARHGRLRLVREAGACWLRSDDESLLHRVCAELGDAFAPDHLTAQGLPVPLARRGHLAMRLGHLGWPLRDEAGHTEGRALVVGWRDEPPLRPYQREAVTALAAPDTPGGGSGLVVLPCGAGKTLVGIGASVAFGCWTLVLCPNSSSVQQWVAAYRHFTDLPPDAIGEYRAPRRHLRPITVTTYQQLTARGSRTGDDLPHLNLLGGQDWGLIVFDEAHLLPADVFRLAADLASRRRLGLTATPVREDGREADLAALIGPVRYDVPWATLESQGWIAPVECVEVRVPLAAGGDDPTHRAAATAPEKWPVVRSLARRHRDEGVLVIGQYLDQLTDLAARLEAPLISGATPRADREAAFARFRAGEEPLLVLSRVGNAAIDLPNARVAIEVSGNYGSRQEEAQRLGRLLRPKPDGAPARFYAVVADTAAEAACAARRQRFLVQQGYRYRIVRAGPRFAG